MDARAKTVREILHSSDQYIIPFFQRHYSWQRKHWSRLLDDIESLLETDEQSQHFMGPLVCTPNKHVPAEVSSYQLIDGQQRLTTITLALAALRDIAQSQKLDDLAAEITEDYLVHKRKQGFDRFKVMPRLGDREALMAIAEGTAKDKYDGTAVDEA
jgi:uncharacterized protein with ParB-like and HNH nuclease domain